MTTTMALETLTPGYLTAHVATADARQAVHRAEVRLGWMVRQNERHADELKQKSRSDRNLTRLAATSGHCKAAQASQRRGSQPTLGTPKACRSAVV